MTRREALIETQPKSVELSASEAHALAELGRKLASKPLFRDDDATDRETSMIQVEPLGGERWQLRVANAIGLIGLPTLQVVVQPKIEPSHFAHLLRRARGLPPIEPMRGWLDAGTDFWTVLAGWLVGSAETLLRRDLMRDYQPQVQTVAALRGSYELVDVALATYRGALTYDCEIDQFTTDMPLNRVVKAGLALVSASASTPGDLRRRAMAVGSRMDDVSAVRTSDFVVAVDSRTAHYEMPVAFARDVLRGTARLLTFGETNAWTFLLRTPSAIEDALRSLVAEGLADMCSVTKHPIPSGVSLNPDLLFRSGGRTAVGDVKYKVSAGDWVRADLYQLVTFAIGGRTDNAVLLTFSDEVRPTEQVRIGDVRVTQIYWPAVTKLSPDDAARTFIKDVRSWYLDTSRRAD